MPKLQGHAVVTTIVAVIVAKAASIAGAEVCATGALTSLVGGAAVNLCGGWLR